MFYQIRYQTGELDEVISEMKKGAIPCMDVNDTEELGWVLDQLSKKGIYRIKDLPYDKYARDRVKEPEFEFRIAFYTKPVSSKEIDKSDIMYIDFYFEPFIEKDYDPIFWD